MKDTKCILKQMGYSFIQKDELNIRLAQDKKKVVRTEKQGERLGLNLGDDYISSDFVGYYPDVISMAKAVYKREISKSALEIGIVLDLLDISINLQEDLNTFIAQQKK